MDQKPGQLVGDKLWLVARYPEEPGVLMKLGSILKYPENLESSLNLHSIETPAPAHVRDASKGIRASVETSLNRDNSALIKAAATVPVFSGIAAGVAVEGHWKHDIGTTVRAMDVHAEAFIPDDDYMERALKNPKVKSYVEAGLFGKRLYIVIGVATAKKLYIKETFAHDSGAGASASAGLPGVVDSGVEIKHNTSSNVTAELEVGESCDFAYRVRQFTYSKVRGLRDQGDHSEKAMFRAGEDYDDDDSDDEEPKYVAKFASLKPSDVQPSLLVGLAE